MDSVTNCLTKNCSSVAAYCLISPIIGYVRMIYHLAMAIFVHLPGSLCCYENSVKKLKNDIKQIALGFVELFVIIGPLLITFYVHKIASKSKNEAESKGEPKPSPQPPDKPPLPPPPPEPTYVPYVPSTPLPYYPGRIPLKIGNPSMCTEVTAYAHIGLSLAVQYENALKELEGIKARYGMPAPNEHRLKEIAAELEALKKEKEMVKKRSEEAEKEYDQIRKETRLCEGRDLENNMKRKADLRNELSKLEHRESDLNFGSKEIQDGLEYYHKALEKVQNIKRADATLRQLRGEEVEKFEAIDSMTISFLFGFLPQHKLEFRKPATILVETEESVKQHTELRLQVRSCLFNKDWRVMIVTERGMAVTYIRNAAAKLVERIVDANMPPEILSFDEVFSRWTDPKKWQSLTLTFYGFNINSEVLLKQLDAQTEGLKSLPAGLPVGSLT